MTGFIKKLVGKNILWGVQCYNQLHPPMPTVPPSKSLKNDPSHPSLFLAAESMNFFTELQGHPLSLSLKVLSYRKKLCQQKKQATCPNIRSWHS